jgi:quinol-cytochrome oxidoreductase complex cytochrome b subunit
LCVLNYFDALISKIIFLKWKNIILMHFGIESTLKSNRNHTSKQAFKMTRWIKENVIIFIFTIISDLVAFTVSYGEILCIVACKIIKIWAQKWDWGKKKEFFFFNALFMLLLFNSLFFKFFFFQPNLVGPLAWAFSLNELTASSHPGPDTWLFLTLF